MDQPVVELQRMSVLSSGYYPQPPNELVSLTIRGHGSRNSTHKRFLKARSFRGHLNISFASRAQDAQIKRLHGICPHETHFFCPQEKTGLGLGGILSRIEGKNVSAVSSEQSVRVLF